MKIKLTCLISILIITFLGSAAADCGKDHGDKAKHKVTKKGATIMDVHFSDLDTDSSEGISREEFHQQSVKWRRMA